MSIYILALLIGITAGLRVLTGPAAVSWAARLGWLHLENTWMSFMGSAYAPYIFSLLAIGELVNDKMPKTPSRKAPPSFAVRILSGAFCGAALCASDSMHLGALMGAAGAVIGTLGGYELRMRLVRMTGGKDLPIALLEDGLTVILAFLIVSRTS